MSDRPNETVKEPGKGVAELPSILSCFAVLWLFYLFVGAAIFTLAGWVGIELVGGYIGGRLRWAFAARRFFREHVALLRLLLRSLKLEGNAETSIALPTAEAPELFSMLEPLCAQQRIHFPPDVFIIMQAEARVRLEGFEQNLPKVALFVGLDLLAGTTKNELHAVIAHELAHARVTRWGARNWLSCGLERATGLSLVLTKMGGGRKKQSTWAGIARLILGVADETGEALALRLASLSRQEELDADRAAAAICGAEVFRDTLLKVEALGRFSIRLSWRERMAQLQSHNFCDWLTSELQAVVPASVPELDASIQDRFSTHPPLRERINALPCGNIFAPMTDERPALSLLADDEDIAEKLIARMLESSLKQEDSDTQNLRRWVREMRSTTQLQPLQVFGAALVIGAEIAGIPVWIIGAGIKLVLSVFGVSILGLFIFWLGRYREQFSLPVPDFGLLKESWTAEAMSSAGTTKAFQSALHLKIADKSSANSISILEDRCYETLSECDYTKAEISAKMLLGLDPESPQGMLTLAICLAWRGQADEAARKLAWLQQKVGLRGPSLCWGMAWAYMLRGNWARAEALLDRVLDDQTSEPTLLNLRALCQARRGKLQSAIINSRHASEPRPKNIEHAKFLINLLIEGGFTREAQARLLPLEDSLSHDLDLLLETIRLDLLFGDFASASILTNTFLGRSPPPHTVVQLAAFYELAGHGETAGHYYAQALAYAHFPDACLGLARVEVSRNNIPAARQHASAALDFRRPLGKFATHPIELLESILALLAMLEPPVREARAWVANVPDNTLPALLAGMSFVVFALTQAKAEKFLLSIISAMSGGAPHVAASNIRWKLAPPEHQPVGFVRPGVQPLWNGVDSSPFRGYQRRGLWQPRHARIQTLLDGMRLLPEAESSVRVVA